VDRNIEDEEESTSPIESQKQKRLSCSTPTTTNTMSRSQTSYFGSSRSRASLRLTYRVLHYWANKRALARTRAKQYCLMNVEHGGQDAQIENPKEDPFCLFWDPHFTLLSQSEVSLASSSPSQRR
jgi:hypothetical protein